jgi:hypothetical protein
MTEETDVSVLLLSRRITVVEENLVVGDEYAEILVAGDLVDLTGEDLDDHMTVPVGLPWDLAVKLATSLLARAPEDLSHPAIEGLALLTK